jgi:hypothetical protein
MMPGRSSNIDEENQPLIQKRPWLEEFEEEPVGGFPGNPKFRDQVMLAFRVAFFACILASAIWIPATKPYVPEGYARYIPLSVLMIVFTMNPVFGGIVGNATAAIEGTFFAVLNIFVLRGFFPDGVQPGDGHLSLVSIVGWVDVIIFNFIFVTMDLRQGVKFFALGHNTGYLLSFLNPQDTMVFSKNFKINPNGTAVICLKVTCIACFLTMCANLLPVPFRFAYMDMKVNARRVSAFVAKNFLSSVEYYRGGSGSILIEKQMMSTLKVEKEIAAMGDSIGSAWYEGFDIGRNGTVRQLHENHHALMSDLLLITKGLEIAIKTEDFASSHHTIMKEIGEASSKLVEDTGGLLMAVTDAARDGDINSSEQVALEQKEEAVTEDLKELAKDFDTIRRNWTPIHREVLNEAYFVFSLSAYARKVCEYSKKLRDDPPEGEHFFGALLKSIKGAFTCEGATDAHSAIAIRCWIALMIGFVYGVFVDHYGGACAITVVFLQSTRVAPDILASLKVLQAVAISSVLSSIIFSRSCETGYGEVLLPLFSFLFWWLMLYVHFSGCSFATIGLLSAALSPFTLVVRCPDTEMVSGEQGAKPLWINIRGFMLALLIMSICEFFSSADSLAKLSYENLNAAISQIIKATEAVWGDEDPGDAIAPVPKMLADAKMYGVAAVQEPRLWKTKWKYDLLEESCTWIGYMEIDVQNLRHAMRGGEGDTAGVFSVLKQLPSFERMRKDLMETMEDSRAISYDLLKHEEGLFEGMSKLVGLEGVDELDGYDDALADVNTLDMIKFPEKEIESIEDDLLCQISIIFVMLQFQVTRVAHVIRACVREA